MFTTLAPLQSIPAHPHVQVIKLLPVEKFIRPGRLLYRLSEKVRQQYVDLHFRKENTAIWHSTYFTNPYSWSGPQIITVYDMIYELYADLFNRPYDDYFRERKKRALLSANLIHCISYTTKKDLCSALPINPERCEVVHLAAKEVFHRRSAKFHIGQQKPYFLFVGNRYHYKNFGTLLQAYSTWEKRESFDLLVASSDPWTSAEQQLLNEYRMEDQIKLVLKPDDEMLCDLYNSAVALVFPSLYEGFGIPLLEAMNCGCPIIASHIPSTVEIARDIPIYFDPLNVEQLRMSLDQVIQEGRDSIRVGMGLEMARKYSWDEAASRILDIYKRLH